MSSDLAVLVATFWSVRPSSKFYSIKLGASVACAIAKKRNHHVNLGDSLNSSTRNREDRVVRRRAHNLDATILPGHVNPADGIFGKDRQFDQKMVRSEAISG